MLCVTLEWCSGYCHTCPLYSKKSLYIGKALEDQMTTHHDIHPQFGAGQFFEFELSNPLATDELIDIQLHDRDVRLVRDLNEWRYLRRVHGVRGGAIEKEMVSVDPMDGTPQIWLRGNETVSVPFVFQSFAMPEEEPEQMAKFKERVAPVSFLLTSTKKPVAILDLHVKRQAWFPVDRTLRFYHPANEMLRTTIAYVPQSMVDAERAFDSDKPSAMYLRASHANILCQFDESVPRNSNASALQLRYRCGGTSSPATSETFYILFYHDPFHTALAGVWRFVVHTTDRLDVHGAVGQKTPASLMVKVAGAGQTVQCHASHADMVTFTPSGTFDLVGNALNEVRIAVRAGATGRQHYLVSMVDVEGGDKGGLVGHWLVNCSSMEPDVTKEFELEVPREVGLSKVGLYTGDMCSSYLCMHLSIFVQRVSYTNPYLSARRFILTSSQPSKLQVKERMLELDSGESTYIHLLFPPLSQQQSGTSASAIVEDHVFLFISDEQEQPEECLRIALSYV